MPQSGILSVKKGLHLVKIKEKTNKGAAKKQKTSSSRQTAAKPDFSVRVNAPPSKKKN